MAKRIGLLAVFALTIVSCLMVVLSRATVIGLTGCAINDYSSDSFEATIYDKDPGHLWNRIHQLFLMRATQDGKVYGLDELDPLLWARTKYLRTGLSHKKAIRLLDEFILSNGERLITDPIKHAMLQRDLWTVFDWLQQVSPDEHELSLRLAKVIQRLSLSSDQIDALPDNYVDAITSKAFPSEANSEKPDEAFLPPELFTANSPWVQITGDDQKPTAPTHIGVFSRSYFSIFMRLPGGRQETIDYLKNLNSFPNPVIKSPYFRDQMSINPEVPRFPVGTQFVLVRRMMLVDNNDNIVPSHLVESVQLRVYRKMVDGFNSNGNRYSFVDKFEFRLRRSLLFSRQSGGLGPINSILFNQFFPHGFDPFEVDRNSPEASFTSDPKRPSSLRVTCSGCHDNHSGISGIGSVGTYTDFGRPMNSVNKLLESNPTKEIELALRYKLEQKDWKALGQYTHA